jgi:hypothetical protein
VRQCTIAFERQGPTVKIVDPGSGPATDRGLGAERFSQLDRRRFVKWDPGAGGRVRELRRKRTGRTEKVELDPLGVRRLSDEYLQKLGIELFEMALFRENTNKPIRPEPTIRNVLGSGVKTTYS